MGIVKGSYVKCNSSIRIGVAEREPDDKGFVYVRWYLSWDQTSGKIDYYVETVHISALQELGSNNMRPGLQMLRRRVIR